MDSYQKALADAAGKKVDAETDYPQPVATPATPTDATNFMGMTEEEKKRLQEALAGLGSFGSGFLGR
jgi:hypothetical protein